MKKIILRLPAELLARLDGWLKRTGRDAFGARHAELLRILEEGIGRRERREGKS